MRRSGCLEGRTNSIYTSCPSYADLRQVGQHHMGSWQKGINSYSPYSTTNVLKGTASTPVDHFPSALRPDRGVLNYTLGKVSKAGQRKVLMHTSFAHVHTHTIIKLIKNFTKVIICFEF